MSYLETVAPLCRSGAGDVEILIGPRERDLGGFSVRRVLPAEARQSVGPFVFFDHLGPAHFPPGRGIDVRPHPHIGLATVTYLFQGRIRHRDSLGCVQDIEPGAVNLMVAGSGIVHSERSTEADRAAGATLHGIQMWMALPDEHEDCAPSFVHHDAAALPVVRRTGVEVRVIMGALFGAHSPAKSPAASLCCEVLLQAGAVLEIPRAAGEEAAVYVVQGAVTVGDCPVAQQTMAVLAPGPSFRVAAGAPARCFIIGGRPPGTRHLWWNFVASDPARIERAKDRWRNGQFDPVPGESEFIPLPG